MRQTPDSPTDFIPPPKLIPALAKRIEHWPIERLIPYARNARTHSDAQIAQIAASIREFGFTNPILVDTQAGVIAGHGRLLAARKLGMTEISVIVLDHLTATQKRAYVIADNRLALSAGWDQEMLGVEVSALEEEDFDINLLGFEDEELAALLAGEQSGLIDEDEVPETPDTAVSAPGDLWLLGSHRLLCADATDSQCFNRVLAGGLADMVFTDPPFNVGYEAPGKCRYQKIANDNLGPAFEQFLKKACTNLLAVTKGAIYICMSSSELHTLQKAFRESGGHWSTFVIWAKNAFTLGRSDYQRQYEPILYGWPESSDHYWCGARDQGDVWFIQKPTRNDLHPTMKPVELVERAIRNSSKSRDTVLDPFGGSGSTLIACEKTGRHARVIELEPRYVDATICRWEQYVNRRWIEFCRVIKRGRRARFSPSIIL
jgi:DNA modification methylase